MNYSGVERFISLQRDLRHKIPEVPRARKAMKVRDVIKLVEQEGWRLVRTKGSHRQYHHPSKPGTVTVAGHPSLDIPPGTLNNILKQAGLK
jgi:predicted RNA binding protein YcfA (HicA-like mRNA interferase family)